MKLIAVNKASTYLFVLAAVLLGAGLLTAFYTSRMAGDLRYDGQIINHAGIIRGGIQRTVKVVLADIPNSRTMNDGIIRSIDSLVTQFKTLEEGYRHRHPHAEAELLGSIYKTSAIWENIKEYFAEYRRARTEDIKKLILIESERCWDAANEVVHLAQRANEKKVRGIRIFYVLAVISVFSTLVVILFVYISVRRQLEHHASRDVVTALLNRRSFNVMLKAEIARSHRYKRDISLVMFDIDFFKAINDTYGHKTGDEVLFRIAELAQQHIRSSDLVFRTGGDEFSLMLPETRDGQALEIAEKICQVIREYAFDPVGQVTVSMGVASLERNMNFSALCLQADNALYHAKELGRDRVCRKSDVDESDA